MTKRTFRLQYVLVAATVATLMAGCGGGMATKPSASSQADAAIVFASDANKRAAAVGYEWRDTGKFIKKAKAAAAKGDDQKAIKLANQAKLQADLAYNQWEHERKLDRSVK